MSRFLKYIGLTGGVSMYSLVLRELDAAMLENIVDKVGSPYSESYVD